MLFATDDASSDAKPFCRNPMQANYLRQRLDASPGPGFDVGPSIVTNDAPTSRPQVRVRRDGLLDRSPSMRDDWATRHLPECTRRLFVTRMNALDRLMNVIRPLPVKGKGRLIDPLLPRSGVRSARVFEARMDLDLADLIQRGVYIGCFERMESSWVRRTLKPGMTFVDVGANIGYFSLLARSLVGGSGRVIAFEPNPRLRTKLADAVAAAGLKGVVVHPIGLSDHEGELTLHLPPKAAGNENASMIEWEDSEGWEHVPVRVRRLDAVLAESGVDFVDLMKIDVEGHERQAFEGLGDRLGDGSIGRILCEFNDPALKQAGTSSPELRAFLLSKGFRDVTPMPWHDDHWLQNRLFVHQSLGA